MWFIEKFDEHRISVHAAQVAFFILISLFPFLMFFFTLLQYTPLSEDMMNTFIAAVIPGSLSTILTSWIHETYTSASGTILSLTAITALWAGSKGFASIAYELDRIYEVPRRRGLLSRRLLSLLSTLVFTLMIIFSLILLVYGNQIVLAVQHFFPQLTGLRLILFLLRSVISFLLFTVYFLCMFRFLPNRKSRFRDELAGASFSAFLWILFSYLYSLYVDAYPSFSSLYGSLTYMILLMLWMYICIILIFLGAMLNEYRSTHPCQKLQLIHSLRELPGLLRLFLENNR
jgi:membrane protein